MDVLEMTQATFQELEEELETGLEGLSAQELAWRPSEGANAIGFTLWHVTRAEDHWISRFALQKPTVFESGEWPERWNIPAKDTGFNYGEEELARFPTPTVDELWEYRHAVRNQTSKYVKGLSQTDFAFKPRPDHPRNQNRTIGSMFTHLFCEIGQHVGHVRYIRGLQRGING